MIDLGFKVDRAASYTSGAQKIRILSEDWAHNSVYCPNCGSHKLTRFPNNSPVADFYCDVCHEEYELKSRKYGTGGKVVDGSYKTMLERLASSKNSNLLLLSYDPISISVVDLVIVPKHFLIKDIIEPRKPLSPSARRAGWTGCNILIGSIPASGEISLIKNRVVRPAHEVFSIWRKTLFLREKTNEHTKGWLINVIRLDFAHFG